MTAPPLLCACCTALMLLMARGAAPLRNRVNFPRKLWEVEVRGDMALETVSRPSVAVNEVLRERRLVWRSLLHKEPPPRHSCTALPHSTSGTATRRRGRRHALIGTRGHGHGQLMRVGCVLGTCQVQNLGHRLYQLIGQSGREESSPVNPRSPHSYG
ncbi:protein ADM2 [Pygocentrus nattereri]|uniref:Adrenomedullin 2b n=1 Tax=Pygocentrus nattereri TaxID=42514 RepID=A0AAR2J8S5_PYGNA|nr:protein ADM2 [Pygocentrus nattereri]XP_017570378.1 protein ADM2 [Pygocentrus nattereri]